MGEEAGGRGVLTHVAAKAAPGRDPGRASVRRQGQAPARKDVRALETMLDYAILEGAELRLPLFVLLLRAARLELMTGIEAGDGERIAADEAACMLAARDVLDSCRHLIQDR
jgi:hypothetical protein